MNFIFEGIYPRGKLDFMKITSTYIIIQMKAKNCFDFVHLAYDLQPLMNIQKIFSCIYI